MSFDTLPFLLLFVLTYAAARMAPAQGWPLLFASVVSYAFAGPIDTALFGLVILVNWRLGLIMRPAARGPLIAAVVFNIGVLAAFKYRNLLLGLDAESQSFVAGVAIPLGISFYTFQSIAYLADIYRGQVIPERSLVRFALFKSFFPQLIAGPIVRAHILLPQVERLFAGTLRPSRLVGFGLLLCLVGIVKKVMGADSLAPIVDDIFARGPAGAFTAWLGIWLFAFQIYFDFSGYSDMAVGMARMLGVKLPVNFRTPYLAASPRAFWQRWHITLSTWIRDYLYQPLGGSRCGGPLRQTLVLVAVMGLAGFWHGANWTFLVWGLLWGGAIALWRVTGPVWQRLPAAAGWLATLLVVLLLWVPFRAPSIGAAGDYLATMLGWSAAGPVSYLAADDMGTALIVLGAAALLALHRAEQHAAGPRLLRLLRRWDGPFLRGVTIALIGWLLILPKTNPNPFIYFRF
jgi:D-alanyl-lipoteichoic acid acyltransferase DltB (MBOAT superfamily)